MYGARKDPVDAAISLPAPHHPVDTRGVDFRQTFCIPVDRQHLPLTSHIERLQDVVEDLATTASAAVRVGPDSGAARQIPQSALHSISSKSLASAGYPSFDVSTNLDFSRFRPDA